MSQYTEMGIICVNLIRKMNISLTYFRPEDPHKKAKKPKKKKQFFQQDVWTAHKTPKAAITDTFSLVLCCQHDFRSATKS